MSNEVEVEDDGVDNESGDDPAVDDDGPEQGEQDTPRPLDALPLLEVIQRAGDAGASVDELQDELKAMGLEHPRGVIYAVALSAVKDGRLRETGADEAGARFWLAVAENVDVDVDATIARRVAILLTIFRAESAEGWAMGDLIADAGLDGDADRAQADIEALASAGVMTATEDGGTYYGFTEDQVKRLEELGAAALVATTVARPDAAGTADRSRFEAEAERKLEEERARRLVAEAKLSRVCGWLDKNGLSSDTILNPKPEPDPVTGATFIFKQSRPVDDAECAKMWGETILLKEQKNLAKARLDSAKAAFKAEEELLDGQIASLEAARACNSRIVEIHAKRVPDWTAKVFRILAVEDGSEIGTEPMPRGTQRPLLGVDESAQATNGATESAAAPASPEAVEGFKAAFDEKTGKASPVEEAPVLVDMANLTKWQKLAYETLKHAGEPVAKTDLGAAAQRFNGKPAGQQVVAHLAGACEELVTVGIVMKGGDAYRVLGAPKKKASPPKSAKARLWEALPPADAEGLLKGELKDATGLSDKELDAELEALKKIGTAVTKGRARGTRYCRAGTVQPEARA